MLEEAFSDMDGERMLAAYKPKAFERLAFPITGDGAVGTRALPEWVRRQEADRIARLRSLLKSGGGFNQLPYLRMNEFVERPAPRLFPIPKVSGHEGRHRSRAIAQEGMPASLMSLYQNSMPESLRFKQLGDLIQPEGQNLAGRLPRLASETFLTEPFKRGGPVKMQKGGVLEFLAKKAAGQRPAYQSAQEGPYFRVGQGAQDSPRGGIIEDVGGFRRSAGRGVREAEESEIRRLIASGQHEPLATARRYMGKQGLPLNIETEGFPESSLQKQAPIARAFQRATEDDNYYPEAVLKAYWEKYPAMMERYGINSYKDLVNKAYRKLGTETTRQFDELPVRMSYHQGEGQYQSSPEMLRDAIGNKHLYVYQGGEKHPGLSNVDPLTGLNDNEKFRAVHDYFGHGVLGNQFGPKGEEKAWLTHQGMMNPLARVGMSSETRGQNSWVNYSGANDKLLNQMQSVEVAKRAARARGEDPSAFEEALRKLAGELQYGKQKSLALPPEMLSTRYAGEEPEYMKRLYGKKRGGVVRMQGGGDLNAEDAYRARLQYHSKGLQLGDEPVKQDMARYMMELGDAPKHAGYGDVTQPWKPMMNKYNVMLKQAKKRKAQQAAHDQAFWRDPQGVGTQEAKDELIEELVKMGLVTGGSYLLSGPFGMAMARAAPRAISDAGRMLASPIKSIPNPMLSAKDKIALEMADALDPMTLGRMGKAIIPSFGGAAAANFPLEAIGETAMPSRYAR